MRKGDFDDLKKTILRMFPDATFSVEAKGQSKHHKLRVTVGDAVVCMPFSKGSGSLSPRFMDHVKTQVVRAVRDAG